MLNQIINVLKPLHGLLADVHVKDRSLAQGLRSVFTNKASRWNKDQAAAVVTSFFPTMRSAHEELFKGGWPASMNHAFQDVPQKLYAFLNVNIGMHEAGEPLHENFVKNTITVLTNAEENIPVLVDNYERLGAGENPDVARALRAYREEIIPALGRALIEVKGLSGLGSLELSHIEKAAQDNRFVGVEAMRPLPEALFPR